MGKENCYPKSWVKKGLLPFNQVERRQVLELKKEKENTKKIRKPQNLSLSLLIFSMLYLIFDVITSDFYLVFNCIYKEA